MFPRPIILAETSCENAKCVTLSRKRQCVSRSTEPPATAGTGRGGACLLLSWILFPRNGRKVSWTGSPGTSRTRNKVRASSHQVKEQGQALLQGPESQLESTYQCTQHVSRWRSACRQPSPSWNPPQGFAGVKCNRVFPKKPHQ